MLSVHFCLLRTPFPGSGRIEPGILRSGAAAGAPCLRQALPRSQPGFSGTVSLCCIISFSLHAPAALSKLREAGGFAELPFPGISPFPEKPTPSAVVGMLIKPSQGHAGRHRSSCGKVARTRDLLSPSPHTGLCTGHGDVPKVAEKSNSFGIKRRRQRGSPGGRDCSTAQLQSLSPAGPGLPEPPRCHQPRA